MRTEIIALIVLITLIVRRGDLTIAPDEFNSGQAVDKLVMDLESLMGRFKQLMGNKPVWFGGTGRLPRYPPSSMLARNTNIETITLKANALLETNRRMGGRSILWEVLGKGCGYFDLACGMGNYHLSDEYGHLSDPGCVKFSDNMEDLLRLYIE